MRNRRFNLWCFLFDHKWAFPFKTTDYKFLSNGIPSGGRTKTKKRRKVGIVKRWHKCERCEKIERIR